MILDINGVKLKWLGHSGFKFNFNELVVYIDPYDIKEKEKADLILITHGHYDHCSIKDIAKIVKDDSLIITTPDTISKFSGKIEQGNIKLVKPGESFSYKDVKIKTVPAYNINKPFHPRANEWVGYLITINNITFYHPGDTDFIPEMADIMTDVFFVPISGTYVMNVDEAISAVKKIMPKLAIPMHYGKIIGSKQDALEFEKKCTFCKVRVMG